MVCTREVRVEANISDKKKDRLKQVYSFTNLGSMISENGGCERRSATSDGSWMGKVARNVRNSMRQEDAHYAQSTSINYYQTVIRPVLM